MKHGASIAILVLSAVGAAIGAAIGAGCGEKPASGGALGSSAPQAGSGTPPASGKDAVATLDETVEYLDGDTPRKLWVSKDLVAEFKPSEPGRAAVLAADPSAQEIAQPQPIVRIWKLAGATRGEAFAQAVWNPAFLVSPVLHEGPSEAFPMRALPGGVVVTFKPDWDRARIDSWLATKSLAISDPVSPEANMFLVTTAPGLAALIVAQELRKTGELADVSANFWRQNVAK